MAEQRVLIKGMTCGSCEKIIRKQAFNIDGVEDVNIDFATGKGTIKFDSKKTDIDTILDKIEEKGYEGFLLEEKSYPTWYNPKWFGYTAMLLGLIVAGYFLLQFTDKIQLPQISPGMGYGLLFLTGLLTGFHCVAMCGGFVVSYTAKDAQNGISPHRSHIAYGIGKLASYTVIGAAFGFVGSIIAFTPFMRGVAGIIAGLFLVVFGLNMLNIFPALRKVRLTTPEFINKFLGKHKDSSPLKMGLMNGLMIACGPLQAIYIMAAGTGSAIEGAKLLFVFGLGTLPVMLGFGYLTSFISSKMTQKILKASGIVVIILGLVMLNRGLILTGSDFSIGSLNLNTASQNVNTNNGIALKDGYQEIRMDVLSSGWSPNKFVLQKGVPVKWIINGKQLNGCNNAIQVPDLGLNFNIKPGEQTIEFTPKEEGTITFSCWMGMITGKFIVKDNVDLENKEAVQKELDAVQVPKGGSCGANGGGCGCGRR